MSTLSDAPAPPSLTSQPYVCPFAGDPDDLRAFQDRHAPRLKEYSSSQLMMVLSICGHKHVRPDAAFLEAWQDAFIARSDSRSYENGAIDKFTRLAVAPKDQLLKAWLADLRYLPTPHLKARALKECAIFGALGKNALVETEALALIADLTPSLEILDLPDLKGFDKAQHWFVNGPKIKVRPNYHLPADFKIRLAQAFNKALGAGYRVNTGHPVLAVGHMVDMDIHGPRGNIMIEIDGRKHEVTGFNDKGEIVQVGVDGEATLESALIRKYTPNTTVLRLCAIGVETLNINPDRDNIVRAFIQAAEARPVGAYALNAKTLTEPQLIPIL